MRALIIGLLTIGLFSWNCENKTRTGTATTPSKELATPDFNVALGFINDYTNFCTKSGHPSKTGEWIGNNSMLTASFKNKYKKLLDSVQRKNPELGLDFDPIFDAQDFPEKGFSILKADTLSGYVTVVGNDWKEFQLVLKLGQEDAKWLVDGAGAINIPEDKRAKR